MSAICVLIAFKKAEPGCVYMVLDDVRDDSGNAVFDRAQSLTNGAYRFHSCSHQDREVPDSAKGRLFMSDKEMFEAAPDLDDKARRLRFTKERKAKLAAQREGGQS